LRRQALALDLQNKLLEQMKTDEMFMQFSKKIMQGDERKAKTLFLAPGRKDVLECRCCDEARQTFQESCGRFTDYSLQYFRILTNACGLVGREVVLDTIKALCH